MLKLNLLLCVEIMISKEGKELFTAFSKVNLMLGCQLLMKLKNRSNVSSSPLKMQNTSSTYLRRHKIMLLEKLKLLLFKNFFSRLFMKISLIKG